MVAGAGNSAVDAGSFVPAAYPEVISVSALADFDAARGGLAGCGLVPDLGWFDCDDTFAFFSNFGASVDVIAPGVSIFSTTKNGGYATQSGTSMATPHVSGVAALMVAANPGLTPAAARTFLQQSGECPNGNFAGADGSCAGDGTWADDPDGSPEPMVNALHAALAAGGRPPAPTAPAAPTLTSATAGNGSAWPWPGPPRPMAAARSPATRCGAARRRQRGVPRGPGRAGHDLHRHDQRHQRDDLLLPGQGGERVGPGPLSNELWRRPPHPPPRPRRRPRP